MLTRLNFTKQDIKLHTQCNWIREARAFYAENLTLKDSHISLNRKIAETVLLSG